MEFTAFLPLILMTLLVGGGLRFTHWLLLERNSNLSSGAKFPRQMGMIGLALVGVVMTAMALPVPETTRNQVIGLIGLIFSGAIAFSSQTLIANLMAGIMLRVTKPFRTGDFITVGEHFGRVTERGLLDTEIQTEHRSLVAIPNTMLIGNAVSVERSSGALVSVELSLGYDLNHVRIERLLEIAAKRCGLEEPFVQILKLGDFSVSYRVSGLLNDVKGLLTARSNLSRSVLDTLHEAGIEIVSPNFMNQRPLPDGQQMIPPAASRYRTEKERKAEDIMFDKAEEAEQKEKAAKQVRTEIDRLEKMLNLAGENAKPRIQERLEGCRARLAELEEKPGEKEAKQ